MREQRAYTRAIAMLMLPITLRPMSYTAYRMHAVTRARALMLQRTPDAMFAHGRQRHAASLPYAYTHAAYALICHAMLMRRRCRLPRVTPLIAPLLSLLRFDAIFRCFRLRAAAYAALTPCR